MSYIIMVRTKVADVARAKEVFAEISGEMDAIAAEGKKAGGIHHRFLEGAGEIIVLDEWESVEAFQNFFGSNEKIKKIMQKTGMIAEPQIEVFSTIQTSDAF